MDKGRLKELQAFSKRTGIHIKNMELLNHAFVHRSSTNESHCQNNERLEFLGDSVLGVVCASYLYKALPDFAEGDLAKIKSVVVSEKALAPVAIELGIDKLLILGHGEEMSGGRKKDAILADCMEAVIAAIYLDQGYKTAEAYILSFLTKSVDEVLSKGLKDYKTLLQEYLQKKDKICPKYEVIGSSGPEHAKVFEVVVVLGDKKIGPAEGKNKKEAEQNAAKMALDSLK